MLADMNLVVRFKEAVEWQHTNDKTAGSRAADPFTDIYEGRGTKWGIEVPGRGLC